MGLKNPYGADTQIHMTVNVLKGRLSVEKCIILIFPINNLDFIIIEDSSWNVFVYFWLIQIVHKWFRCKANLNDMKQ